APSPGADSRTERAADFQSGRSDPEGRDAPNGRPLMMSTLLQGFHILALVSSVISCVIGERGAVRYVMPPTNTTERSPITTVAIRSDVPIVGLVGLGAMSP